MAAHQTRMIARALAATLLVVMCAVALPPPGGAQSGQPGKGQPTRPVARRIVSLVPALTEMIFAIGAGGQIVGVSSYDTFPPEVARLPRVGALLDPDTERILTLRPDLVTMYGSQVDARVRFERAGIRTFAYRHAGIGGALDAIRELGDVTGHRAQANVVVKQLQARLDALRTRVRAARRPRVLLVFERTPQTLRNMYVSGGAGFLNEMLEAAGAVNVFADVEQESVQPSHETLLTRAPDVILEIRARGLIKAEDTVRERAIWAALPSLPAVRAGRIHILAGDQLVVPGPRLAEGAEMMARAIHPELFR